MYRYRQNIQKLKSNVLKGDAQDDYGMTPRVIKTERKQLKSKSKSHKDILIAKNKKLPEQFKIPHSIPHEIKSPKNRQVKLGQQLNNFEDELQKNPNINLTKQNGCDFLRTSYFGGQSKIKKQNHQMKPLKLTSFHPQTFASDRAEAVQLKQRLKKSTSMKNLIQQKFLNENLHSKNNPANIYTSKNQEPNNVYDSTKYNWRLSLSKEKLSKEKSMSALSHKAILICELNKKEPNKNKLTLSNFSQNFNQNKMKLYSQRSLRDGQNTLETMKKSGSLQKGSPPSEEQKLAYTFGSDVVNSLDFN